jgi:hypothetical protein
MEILQFCAWFIMLSDALTVLYKLCVRNEDWTYRMGRLLRVATATAGCFYLYGV